MKYVIVILFLILSVSGITQTGQSVTNQTIIDLHKAGLGKEVLLSKIQTSTCVFDLSTDALIKLKNEKVPEEVITAMLTKSSSPSPSQEQNTINGVLIPTSSGLYYLSDKSYIEIDPSVLTNQKAGGLGVALKLSVSGLFNSKQKASLSGPDANTQLITQSPTFLFVFDTTSGGFNNSSTAWSTVQSPNEFFLVKLEAQKKERELTIGKGNSVKEEIGIDNDIKVSFTSRKIKKGVYEVLPTNTLKKGEFCFMFAASSMYGGQTHKVYDFGVK
jgi:hypothetical protein